MPITKYYHFCLRLTTMSASLFLIFQALFSFLVFSHSFRNSPSNAELHRGMWMSSSLNSYVSRLSNQSELSPSPRNEENLYPFTTMQECVWSNAEENLAITSVFFCSVYLQCVMIELQTIVAWTKINHTQTIWERG